MFILGPRRLAAHYIPVPRPVWPPAATCGRRTACRRRSLSWPLERREYELHPLLGELVRRYRPGRVRRHPAHAPIVGGPRPAGRNTSGLGAEERLHPGEALLGHGLCLFGCCSTLSVPSASSLAKSSEAFPWTSRASLCRRSWSSRRSTLRASLSTSLCVASFLPWPPWAPSRQKGRPRVRGATRRYGRSTSPPGAITPPWRQVRRDVRTPPRWRACRRR